ncbi:fructokinase [Gloeobacter kilaueensis JS1]|uniref:Fructokinase n=2 Tax=Gloeobacter TaxID=33071 RepID=U5QMD6_GLOK1|nr:fructokinase [Gloeobacter kilaueensis JS1]
MLLDCLADQPDRLEAEVSSWTSYPGGAPANAACALARLGTPVHFIGALGDDFEGDKLLTVLQSSGVQTAGVQRAALPTRKVYVTRTSAGERTFSSFGGDPPDAFADTHLEAEAIPDALFEGAGFISLGTLMAAYPISGAAIFHALDLADEHFVKVCLDINWRPVFWDAPDRAAPIVLDLIARADVLKVSEEDAEWLGLTSLDAIAERFDQLEAIFLTRGERGCLWQVGSAHGEHPGYRVSTVDTTGAGDTFTAALLHQFNQLSPMKWPGAAPAIVDYASAAAALSTTSPGGIGSTPDDATIRAFLHGQVRAGGPAAF